jgi:hypothetical protein
MNECSCFEVHAFFRRIHLAMRMTDLWIMRCRVCRLTQLDLSPTSLFSTPFATSLSVHGETIPVTDCRLEMHTWASPNLAANKLPPAYLSK